MTSNVRFIIALFMNMLIYTKHSIHCSTWKRSPCNTRVVTAAKCFEDRSNRIIKDVLRDRDYYKISEELLAQIDEPHCFLRLTAISLNRMHDIRIKSGRHRQLQNSTSFDVLIPLVNATASYELKGKILGFPIDGKGNLQFVLNWALVAVTIPHELTERNGSKFVRFSSDRDDMRIAGDDSIRGETRCIERTIYNAVKIIIKDLLQKIGDGMSMM